MRPPTLLVFEHPDPGCAAGESFSNPCRNQVARQVSSELMPQGSALSLSEGQEGDVEEQGRALVTRLKKEVSKVSRK